MKEEKNSEDILETVDKNTEKEQNRERVLIVIIFILLFLLMLLGFGYMVFVRNYQKNIKDNNNTNNSSTVQIEQEYKEKEEDEYEDVEIDSSSLATTRIKNILGILNNRYKINDNDVIGYIYKANYNSGNPVSSDYIIYTAINYLNNRNELDNNSDNTYNKVVTSDKVDKTIKSIFGNVKYDASSYSNNSTCPTIKYEDNYYYINTNCNKGDLYIDTFVYKIVESPTKIDMYQAIAYEKNNKEEFGIYKDKQLNNKESEDRNFELNIVNYNSFNKYKFTFTKGSDGQFHFDSIEKQ